MILYGDSCLSPTVDGMVLSALHEVTAAGRG